MDTVLKVGLLVLLYASEMCARWTIITEAENWPFQNGDLYVHVCFGMGIH